MSGQLPTLSPRRVVAALKRAGFVEHRQRGSHLHLRHANKPLLVTVPMHAGDLKRGTLAAILRQASISIAEFRKLL